MIVIPSLDIVLSWNDANTNGWDKINYALKLLVEAVGAPSDITPPATPTSLISTTQTDTTVSLSWTASTDPESGISNYKIYRCEGTTCSPTFLATSNTASYQDTNLKEGTTYTYQVSAVNGAGLESAKTSPVSAATIADTTKPTITSLSAATQTQVQVVFSEPIEQTSAQTISNYSISLNITISQATLGLDLKTVTLTTSPHTDNTAHTLTVNNIKDRATTPNTILANSQKTYTYISKLIISNITAASGRIYQAVDNLQNSSLAYIDRTFTYSSIPASFLGLTYIKTANDDKASTGAAFLSFDINQDAAVYVAHDDRYLAKPSWLQGFVNTGEKISITNPFTIFQKDFTKGRVTLGGNTDSGGDNNMYTVIITAKGLTTAKGDINKDGFVDILDVQALVNHILGAQDLGMSADVNNDGSVDVLDVQEVVNIILGG